MKDGEKGEKGVTLEPFLPADPQERVWQFTLKDEKDKKTRLLEYLSRSKATYIFQEETGQDGYEHLQGCMRWKSAKKFSTLKNQIDETIHLEKCIDWEALVQYCQKGETRTGKVYHSENITTTDELDPLYNKTPFKWQQEILDIIEKEPDDRSIYWFWDKKGCKGKSALAKHICTRKKNAICLGGKGSDMKFAIAQLVQKHKTPKIILIDIPRVAQGYVSWGAIEEIKNGMFFSGKYESGQVLMPNPHVIIFANFEPTPEELKLYSADRWQIAEIK